MAAGGNARDMDFRQVTRFGQELGGESNRTAGLHKLHVARGRSDIAIVSIRTLLLLQRATATTYVTTKRGVVVALLTTTEPTGHGVDKRALALRILYGLASRRW